MSQLEEIVIGPEPEVILANSNTLQCTATTSQNTRILGNVRPVPSKSTSWVFEGHYFGLIRDKWADNKFICNLCHPIDQWFPTWGARGFSRGCTGQGLGVNFEHF